MFFLYTYIGYRNISDDFENWPGWFMGPFSEQFSAIYRWSSQNDIEQVRFKPTTAWPSDYKFSTLTTTPQALGLIRSISGVVTILDL